jgi:hypothetical protein
VTSSTPSQTVTAGQTSGPYSLTIKPVGVSFSGSVTLACSTGLPAQAQCLFNPSTPVTPGNSAVDVVMSISSGSRKSVSQARPSPTRSLLLYTLWLFLPGVVFGWGRLNTQNTKHKAQGLGSILVLVLVTLSLLSCGGVTTGGGNTSSGNPPVTYTITVTGTSPGVTPDAGQSVQVILVVD